MDPNSVSIATDITSGINTHAKNAPMFWDLYEGPAPMNWAPGSSHFRHALSGTVLHKGEPIVQSAHDLGPLLPHGPANFFMNALKSKRSAIYAASQVVAESKAVACVDTLARTFMMACGDISLPQALNQSNVVHTVFIGMSEMDRLRGDVAIFVSVVADVVNTVISFATLDLSRELAKSESAAWAGTTTGVLGFDPKSTLTGMATSLVASTLVSAASGWKEPISIKVAANSPFLAGEVEHTWTPASGEETRTLKVRVHTAQAELKTSKDQQGDWSTSYKAKESSSGKSWGGAL